MTTFVMDKFEVYQVFTNKQILMKIFKELVIFIKLVTAFIKNHLIKSSATADLCSPHYFWMELLSIGYPFVKDLILENPSKIPMVKLIDQYMNYLI